MERDLDRDFDGDLEREDERDRDLDSDLDADRDLLLLTLGDELLELEKMFQIKYFFIAYHNKLLF